jgi:hypothetical protein
VNFLLQKLARQKRRNNPVDFNFSQLKEGNKIKYCLLILLIASIVVGSSDLVKSQSFSRTPSNIGLSRYLQPGKSFPDYPPLSATGINRSVTLPPMVDNSTQPYLRPVFSQTGASCGQSASVGYNFCYEINRLRNLPADTSINTYPDHFTYNFMNATYPYYGQGVSYFHTFDILYDAGNPTEAVYGPMDTDNYYWMSGYEKYYSAMQNRISGVNSIDVSTPEGLLLLKHWLHNHLDGLNVGGVANFQAGLDLVNLLPPESVEAGKYVITQWGGYASHAMTIVGYNDSIRFDRNGDGIFTNHIDINGDDIVDMQDWEIGGLKFVNSYGDDWWGDEGFCYMLYSTLAEKYGEGGIWNNSTHVVFPDTSRTTLLTIKVNLKYNKRGRIKLSVGISSDTSRFVPEHTMDFSIFNYQGRDFYMTGNNNVPSGKILELGLDITPLLSYVGAGSAARIFLVVDEKDPENSGEGEILDFEVIKYNANIPTAFRSNETPAAINNNNQTLVSAIFDNDRNPPNIALDEFQLVAPGNNYTIPEEVSGGTSPYIWGIQPVYHTSDSMGIYLPSQGEALIPTDNSNGYAGVNLPFGFHFFDKMYDSVYMHVNGYLMFERADMPYYYLHFDESYLQQIRSIAGCMHHELGIRSPQDYMKSEINAEKAVFWWRLSNETATEHIEFSVTLFPDGSVKFQYGANSLSSIRPITGLSSGNSRSYLPASRNQFMPREGEIRSFCASLSKQLASISTSGEISLQIPEDFVYGQFLLCVKDKNGLFAEKTITLTTGIVAQIEPGSTSALFSPGANVPLSLKVSNLSQQAYEIDMIHLSAASSNVSISGNASGFTIAAGETLTLNDSFLLHVVDSIQSVQPLKVKGHLTVNGAKISAFSCFESSFPDFVVSPLVVIDSNNNIAEAGEKVWLMFNITNTGNASAGDVNVTLNLSSPYAALCDNPTIGVGELGAFSRKSISFPMQVNEAAPAGLLVDLKLNSESQLAGSREDFHRIALGSTNIVVIDMDGNKNSAIHLAQAIRQNSINCDRIEIIDTTINNYDIVLLCLGSFMHNHFLSPYEDSLLVAHLDRGGGLYLEGGTFFKQDQPTLLRSRFGVLGASQAFAHPADTLVGRLDTPVEGISFDYQGEYIRGENLIVVGTSEPWFSDKHTSFNFIVAHDSANINTIASTVEFGGFFMLDGPGRSDLAGHYLDFLGLSLAPFCASFNASATQICTGNTVTFLSEYNQTPTSWNWTFPGGTPDTWNGPEPVIKYNTAGVYDAQLVVKNGSEANAFTIKQLIDVKNCNGIVESKIPLLKVYPNPASDLISLELPFSNGQAEVSVLDARGVEIWGRKIDIQNHIGQLSLPHLESGIYFLRVTNGSQTFATKLILR